MPRLRWIRPVAFVLGACLGTVIVLERVDVLRTDSLAALSCTTLLVSDRPDRLVSVREHKSSIVRSADEFDLPPELLAANVVSHEAGLTPFRAFTDCAGSAMGANLSLGPAQVRISTAALTETRRYQSLSPAEFKAYRRDLLTPDRNIWFQARELRHLLTRTREYAEMDADTLLESPAVMARVISDYREGAADPDRVSGYALGTLQLLLGDALYAYERSEVDRDRVQARIDEYLESIYCRSGMFNTSTCEAWLQRRANGS
jgi:hypothetical protein